MRARRRLGECCGLLLGTRREIAEARRARQRRGDRRRRGSSSTRRITSTPAATRGRAASRSSASITRIRTSPPCPRPPISRRRLSRPPLSRSSASRADAARGRGCSNSPTGTFASCRSSQSAECSGLRALSGRRRCSALVAPAAIFAQDPPPPSHSPRRSSARSAITGARDLAGRVVRRAAASRSGEPLADTPTNVSPQQSVERLYRDEGYTFRARARRRSIRRPAC